MNYFDMVGEFHDKFELPTQQRTGMRIITPDELEFRLKFLSEEKLELVLAHLDRNTVRVADALADLVYVALGTAHFYGIPFDPVFRVVHDANMKKERVPNAAASKRGSAWDVRKPPGWVGPEKDIESILRSQLQDIDFTRGI